MPPTFLIFIGLILYAGLLVITLLVCLPILLIESKSLLAKKVIATVLVSFPCLIIVGLAFAIIFLIPALLFHWLWSGAYISNTITIVLSVVGLFIFSISVAAASLYLWYFTSRIIYNKLDKKPVSEFLKDDRIFQKFISPFLTKLKII